jgi:pilus assembly protein FimV
MTDGTGPGWNRICAWGLSIDPHNPLYQPGYQPGGTPAATESGATSSLTDTTIAQPADVELAPTNDAAVDLDLDLDFSADDQAAPTDESVTSVPTAQDEALAADIADNALDMDLDLDLDIEAAPDGAPSTNFTPVIEMPDISLSLDDLDLSLDDAEPAKAELPVEPAPAPSTDLMDFDLEALSMELDAEAQSPVDAPDNLSGDPMGTKLELAEEFISIGDEDGARALIEEVLEEATGEMLAKAQKALAQLS